MRNGKENAKGKRLDLCTENANGKAFESGHNRKQGKPNDRGQHAESFMVYVRGNEQRTWDRKEKVYRDFLPEFEKINAKYDEFYKADGNREYADLWLKREVAAITDEDVKIGEEDFTI